MVHGGAAGHVLFSFNSTYTWIMSRALHPADPRPPNDRYVWDASERKENSDSEVSSDFSQKED